MRGDNWGSRHLNQPITAYVARTNAWNESGFTLTFVIDLGAVKGRARLIGSVGTTTAETSSILLIIY